jgi:hypothetical protein
MSCILSFTDSDMANMCPNQSTVPTIACFRQPNLHFNLHILYDLQPEILRHS